LVARIRRGRGPSRTVPGPVVAAGRGLLRRRRFCLGKGPWVASSRARTPWERPTFRLQHGRVGGVPSGRSDRRDRTPPPRARRARRARAYIPGRSAEEVMERFHIRTVIKLGSNENPLGSPPRRKALIRSLDRIHTIRTATAPGCASGSRNGWALPAHFCFANGVDNVLTCVGLAYLDAGDRCVRRRADLPPPTSAWPGPRRHPGRGPASRLAVRCPGDRGGRRRGRRPCSSAPEQPHGLGPASREVRELLERIRGGPRRPGRRLRGVGGRSRVPDRSPCSAATPTSWCCGPSRIYGWRASASATLSPRPRSSAR